MFREGYTFEIELARKSVGRQDRGDTQEVRKSLGTKPVLKKL